MRSHHHVAKQLHEKLHLFFGSQGKGERGGGEGERERGGGEVEMGREGEGR